jgi:hypothetical protein
MQSSRVRLVQIVNELVKDVRRHPGILHRQQDDARQIGPG